MIRFKRISSRFSLSNEKGQALVELAITLPILLLMICAIIDFGWFLSNQLTLSYCSREGARYGIVHANDTGAVQAITDRVIAVAPDYISDKITVAVTFSNPTSRRLGDVTVHVEAGIVALTPVTGVFVQGETVTLVSQCVMKAE